MNTSRACTSISSTQGQYLPFFSDDQYGLPSRVHLTTHIFDKMQKLTRFVFPQIIWVFQLIENLVCKICLENPLQGSGKPQMRKGEPTSTTWLDPIRTENASSQTLGYIKCR